MKKRWIPWAAVGGAIVVIVGVLLIWNPPFVQSILWGSKAQDKDAGKIVARVGSSKLTLKDFQTLVLLTGQDPSRSDVLETMINPWVEQEVIYQEALKKGILNKDTVRMALEQLDLMSDMQRKQLVVQAWLAEERKTIRVSPQELEAYYNAHKEDFLYEVKVSQILMTDFAQANMVYSQLQSGADFRKLAEQYTMDSLKGRPTPYISRYSGYFPVPVAEKIFSLKPGQFTEPLSISPGLILILRLEDKQKVRKDAPFADVAPYINAKLLSDRTNEIITAKVDSLKKAAQSKIEIRVENLIR